jgi:small subunit ribosomal protein S3
VGQKTHPTGFRTGVNKSHKVVWFANYGAYNKVLKEDYKIRKFIEKKFGSIYNKEGISIYNKAGIAKLEIQRKVNQLELIIHAARPKAIAGDKNQANYVSELKESLRSLITDSKKIRIIILQVTESVNESSLVSRDIANQLEKRVAFRKAIRQTTQMLESNGVKGFKIQVSGRLNGAEIARAEWVRKGRVPLQTLRAGISYCKHQANTIYGVLGIKVWIFNGEII